MAKEANTEHLRDKDLVRVTYTGLWRDTGFDASIMSEDGRLTYTLPCWATVDLVEARGHAKLYDVLRPGDAERLPDGTVILYPDDLQFTAATKYDDAWCTTRDDGRQFSSDDVESRGARVIWLPEMTERVQ